MKKLIISTFFCVCSSRRGRKLLLNGWRRWYWIRSTLKSTEWERRGRHDEGPSAALLLLQFSSSRLCFLFRLNLIQSNSHFADREMSFFFFFLFHNFILYFKSTGNDYSNKKNLKFQSEKNRSLNPWEHQTVEKTVQFTIGVFVLHSTWVFCMLNCEIFLVRENDAHVKWKYMRECEWGLNKPFILNKFLSFSRLERMLRSSGEDEMIWIFCESTRNWKVNWTY